MGNKTKTFLAVIPFQGKDKEGNDLLKAATYLPVGNDRLAYGETRFPIIPVIAGYANQGDRIRVIAIKTEGNNYEHNYDTYFVPEVQALCKQKGLCFNAIEAVSTPNKETIEVQLKLFSDTVAKSWG